MKKLLFITWSISYGYGTEKSLADILNRMYEKYDISILPIIKNSNNNIFNSKIKILDSLLDYTKKDFDEQYELNNYYKILGNPGLFNRLIKEKYDCIIACNHNAPSYLASYITNTPKVVWIRGDLRELDYKNLNPLTVEYTKLKNEFDMQNNVFKEFDSIVVISENVKKSLKEKFGIYKNVYKISNSIDKEKIQKLSNEYVDISKNPVFTNLGRLDENKNQLLILKAVKILSSYKKDFIVYLLGEGEEREQLEKYIKENNIEKNVKILGFKENPYPYIKNSMATITTSLSEGFGLVLVESALLNTPIISTDVGVAKEIIEKYKCGSLIDYNEKNLANTMLEYIEKCNKKKTIFNINEDFSLEQELNQTIEIVEDTMKKSFKKTKLDKLPYPVERIDYDELENYNIIEDKVYILEINKDEVKYEYLINRRKENDKLIVFNNGAIAGGRVKYPVFQRHSWIPELKTSAILCMDPTLYINDLSAGWGIGKNENYYLEKSALILKQIIEKMHIELSNTVIYGTSAGGFLSIMMGIYLKGAIVVADNSQFILSRWIVKPALDTVMLDCFDNIADSLNYLERFDVIEAFKKNKYVPKMYIHVNVCSMADNSEQLVPFLKKIENTKGLEKYTDINVILHYEETKGHEGLNKDEALDFIYNLLKV